MRDPVFGIMVGWMFRGTLSGVFNLVDQARADRCRGIIIVVVVIVNIAILLVGMAVRMRVNVGVCMHWRRHVHGAQRVSIGLNSDVREATK